MRLEDLKSLIENKEGKKRRNYSKTVNKFDIAPVNSIGSPIEDESARPSLVFNIDRTAGILNLR